MDLEEVAKKERRRIEELLARKGMRYGSYPKFTVAVKGQKVNTLISVDPTNWFLQTSCTTILAHLNIEEE